MMDNSAELPTYPHHGDDEDPLSPITHSKGLDWANWERGRPARFHRTARVGAPTVVVAVPGGWAARAPSRALYTGALV